MRKKTKVEKITNILSFDGKTILWDSSPVQYRVALMIMPPNELSALCQFFKTDKQTLETRFQLL